MFELEVSRSGLPVIRDDCTHPPPRLLKHLGESLRSFGAEELEGLDAVWLLNVMPEPGGVKVKEALDKGGCVSGMYHARSEKYSSYVRLFVNEIYRGVRGHLPLYHLTPVPVLLITRVLAHEVAHHLAATRGYIFARGERGRNEESLADHFALRHLEKLKARPKYRFGFWLMGKLARVHYDSGVVYSSRRDYCAASECWFMAWRLNPELKDVSAWYHLAREKCKGGVAD
jgi:hypothetical protein